MRRFVGADPRGSHPLRPFSMRTGEDLKPERAALDRAILD
jgi:hypothetical protein